MRTFRVSRIRSDIRFATRKERDFRVPPDFDIDLYRGRAPWQIGPSQGEAKIGVGRETAWWVERAYGDSGRVENGVFTTEYSSLRLLASWILRQDGRALPIEPAELREEVARALRLVEQRHSGEAARAGARARRSRRQPRAGRPSFRPGRPGAFRACCRPCSRTFSPPAASGARP